MVVLDRLEQRAWLFISLLSFLLNLLLLLIHYCLIAQSRSIIEHSFLSKNRSGTFSQLPIVAPLILQSQLLSLPRNLAPTIPSGLFPFQSLLTVSSPDI